MGEAKRRQQQTLAMRINEMLIRNNPNFAAADPVAVKEAADAVADVLGAVLAPVLLHRGPENYKEALAAAVRRANDQAGDAVNRARAILARQAH